MAARALCITTVNTILNNFCCNTVVDLWLTGVDVPRCRSGLVRLIKAILLFHRSFCANTEIGFNYAYKCF